MLGKVVYILRAMQDGHLHPFHGKQLHGALFHLLKTVDDSYSARIHDATDKPFSMSPLFHGNAVRTWDEAVQMVKEGQYWCWRVSGLDDAMLQHLEDIPCGAEFIVNDIRWRIEQCCTRRDEHVEAGRFGEQDLLRATEQMQDKPFVRMTFLMPTMFRRLKFNYPWPTPDVLFPSLAIRWSRLGLSDVFSPDFETISRLVVPNRWEGKSVHIQFDRHQQFEGYVGSFSYNLNLLTPEQRRQIHLLAWFAAIAGVGRMTTHALGTVRCE